MFFHGLNSVWVDWLDLVAFVNGVGGFGGGRFHLYGLFRLCCCMGCLVRFWWCLLMVFVVWGLVASIYFVVSMVLSVSNRLFVLRV